MSDQPTGANGKRSRTWGTSALCPACGRCLCFACHPHGPCFDEHEPEFGWPGQPMATPGDPAADPAHRQPN